MDKKIILLDSLSDGDNIGEGETEILKYFIISEVKITIEELKELLSELLIQNLIEVSDVKDSNNNPMYIMTKKGKDLLREYYYK